MRNKIARLRNRIRAIKLDEKAIDEILFGTLMDESFRLFGLTEKKTDRFCFRLLMNESRNEAIFYVCDETLTKGGCDYGKTDHVVSEYIFHQCMDSIYNFCPNKIIYSEMCFELPESKEEGFKVDTQNSGSWE